MIDQWSATGGLMRHCTMQLWTEHSPEMAQDGPRNSCWWLRQSDLDIHQLMGSNRWCLQLGTVHQTSLDLGVHRKRYGRVKSFITTIINHSSSSAVPQNENAVFQWLDMCPDATQPLLNCQSLQPLLIITFTTSIYKNS